MRKCLLLFCVIVLVSPVLLAQRVGTSSLYLDSIQTLVQGDVRFPQSASFGGQIYIFYQRIVSTASGQSQSIAYRSSPDGFRWSEERELVPDIPLETDIVPPIYSLAHNSAELGVAVSIAGLRTEFFSKAVGQPPSAWLQESINNEGEEFIGPKLIASSTGMMLFGSRRTQRIPAGESVLQNYRSIAYTFRANGVSFHAPRILPVPDDQTQVLNPHLLEKGGQLYLAYENRGFSLSTGITNQIYITRTQNAGDSWSEPFFVTDFVDFADRSEAGVSSESYINQNPRLYEDSNGQILLLSDRNRAGQNIRVSLSRLDESGGIIRYRNQDNEYISEGNRSSSASVFFIQEGVKYVLYYFDTLGGSRVFLAREGPRSWTSEEISSGRGINFLPQVAVHKGKVNFFWLQRSGQEVQPSSLIFRTQDQVVASPGISPVSYTRGRVSNNREVSYALRLPDDPSGLSSIRYAWTQKNTVSENDFSESAVRNNIELLADKHGTWNFFLQIIDNAGNRSDYSRISYELDLVPPEALRFARLPLDEDGYLFSNTVDIRWVQGRDDDLSGYRTRLRFLGTANEEITNVEERIAELRAGVIGDGAAIQTDNFFSLNNADNGLWALLISAVDRVGNESEAVVEFIRLNKYVPVTELYFVTFEENIAGTYSLSFNGRGYRTNGILTSIIFDRDGELPWDYELRAGDGRYRIDSDRRISQIDLSGFTTDDYIIGLNHSERGLYIHSERLVFELGGAIKLGNYSLYRPEKARTLLDAVFAIPVQSIIIFIVVFLLLLIILISLFRIRSILKDNRDLEAEVTALIEGRGSPSAKKLKERLVIVQRQGIGLRLKFTVLMLILVIAVVSLVAIPLSSFILVSQRQILAQGLEDRIAVMLESLASGAAAQLRDTNIVNTIRGLGELGNQISAVEEIEYITITSRPNPNEPGLDPAGREYIWFSTDPLLFASENDRQAYKDNIDEEQHSNAYFERRSTKPAAEGFRPGVHSIQDAVSGYIGNEAISTFNSNNEDAAIRQLVENLGTILRQRLEGGAVNLQESLQQENELRSRLLNELERYTTIGSEPVLSVENYDINSQYYTIYYPIYWLNEGFTANYQGSIRLGISTEIINAQIRDTQRSIIVQVLIFTAIAISAGVAGALLLASITINPIKKLVSGVEKIRDTEIKSELRGSPIIIKTRDELNFLSDTINQMTDGLIKAEQANKSVMLGKDVQKMFIRLDANPYDEKTKASTLHETTDFVEFFGYYEGAKGVSGDYFYYQKIDDRTYAMIKCDVSGKDIEAALIMVTVATLFLQHFENWQEKQRRNMQISHALKQTHSQAVLSNLAENINTIIYEREFKGKFAAFNLLTLDEQSGEVTFCNAGDNVVHIYRRKERKVLVQEFSRTPAAGAISEQVTGVAIEFPEEKFYLNKGDILLLFTDGYDEARRYLRHENWEVYQENAYTGEEGGKALQALEEEMEPYVLTQDEGGLAESFSIARIHAVVNAVMNGSVFTLTKFRNPASAEQLLFDFSTMEPTLANLILALISVERVFRLVPLPGLGDGHRISIDKKIDGFLKSYFLQYSSYFNHPLAVEENSLYQRYSYIAEDSQYDDLTILAVEKKTDGIGGTF